MWEASDGATPEVTLETSMGPFTLEVPPLLPWSVILGMICAFSIDDDGSWLYFSPDVLQAHPKDVQELRGARQEGLLRQRRLPPDHQGFPN